jgi:hypothetical protein
MKNIRKSLSSWLLTSVREDERTSLGPVIAKHLHLKRVPLRRTTCLHPTFFKDPALPRSVL